MSDQANDSEEAEPLDTPVEIPITDTLDLHPFRPSDAAHVAADYLQAAHEAGFRRVRLVHGKGSGVLKRGIRAMLEQHPLVSDAFDADDGGNWGATIVILQ